MSAARIRRGDTVVFTFGCTDTEFTGRVLELVADPKTGRPAAWMQVAGFPAWRHREPLEHCRLVAGDRVEGRAA